MRGALEAVTVWNRWKNPATNKYEWYRHVLPGCSWEHKAIRTVSGQTASIASVTTVLISENPQFVNYDEWENLTGDRTAFFTLQTGDLIALGEQTVEITGVTPNKLDEVQKMLAPEVFTVKVFQNNTQFYKKGRHLYAEGT